MRYTSSMLDIKFIRDNADLVKQKSKQKGNDVDVGKLLQLDERRRNLHAEIEKIYAQSNKNAKDIVAHKKDKNVYDALVDQGKKLRIQSKAKELQLEDIELEFEELLKSIPNMPTDDVPVGDSEDDNKVVKEWGEKPKFDFEPKSHWQIGEERGWIDKERAAKVAGSRFVYLKGELVNLQFALLQFALNQLTNEDILKKIIKDNELKVSSKPFIPVLPPAVARTGAYEATARLNKEEQTYKLAEEDLWLNASAEHTLAPMYLDEILSEGDLPIRYVGYTTAFRREAGSYGKDTEGIFRLHQFDKLEMESFNLPEDAMQEHLFMIAIQEYLMQQLELPYQVIMKCTADIGGPNARGVDINAWLPAQKAYRETHTADYITDYQTRRMKTRVRRQDGSMELPHTNDATAFSQRPLIAIIENYQTKDGKVKVPKVLQSYMGGKTEL